MLLLFMLHFKLLFIPKSEWGSILLLLKNWSYRLSMCLNLAWVIMMSSLSRPMIFTFDFQQSSHSCYCLHLLDEKTEGQRAFRICSQTWGQQMLQLELGFWHSKKHFYQMCELTLQCPPQWLWSLCLSISSVGSALLPSWAGPARLSQVGGDVA